MSKNRELAAQILECLGEGSNISNAYHCMTRLRVLLKDDKAADLEKIKAIKGVLGVQTVNGEIQIIIGTTVANIYNELVAMTGIERKAAIDENLDASLSKKITAKGILNGILDAFSACVSPIIPLLIVTGVFNLVAILLGPNFFNLITEDSTIYSNFYFVSQSCLYFLPFFIAYTAAKHFKCNPVITMAIAAFLLYPNFLSIVSAAGDGATYSYLGISVPLINYSSALLPLMLTAWVQSYVEKLLQKYIPDILKTVLVPAVTVLIMLPLTLCLLGPLATNFGNALNACLVWLYGIAGPVETTIVGAIAIIGVAFGFLRPVYFTGLMAFLSTGVDYTTLPMLAVICNFVAMGATVGYIIKVRAEGKREFGITCFVSNLLGGVSEPSIFGIFMVEKVMLLTTAIGGAAAGLVQGILKVGYFQRGTSNVFGVLSFVAPDGSANFINGLITCAVGFGVTLVATLILYRGSEKK